MEEKTAITARCEALRQWMNEQGVQAFIIPSTDPHASEYVPARWMTRQWISGFDGSAGTAVVTTTAAALWTDSRYYLQAAEQLDATPFCLMKGSEPETPTIAQWLATVLPKGSVVGIDAEVNMVADWRTWQEELEGEGLHIKLCNDPAEALWDGRPTLPSAPVEVQPLEWAGETVTSKLARVRETLTSSVCAGEDAKDVALLVTQLDEVAWLTNLRGTDVHCTPVFVAYALVTTATATLYINKEKLTAEVEAHLTEAGFAVKSYTALTCDLQQTHVDRLLLDPSTTNCALWQAVGPKLKTTEGASPIAMMKAIKNEAETAGFREAMRHDGVAMVRFLRWLEEETKKLAAASSPSERAEGEALTEITVDRVLTAFRAESPLYRDLSFDTIAAYGKHGAIVHYEATPDTDIPLEPRGLLLLDSGAQYTCGTTDITRTIPLGPLSDEERRDYTLVLKGHIRLALTRFPKGAAGTQIDALARYAMWQEGINYGHGTGHGVGSRLSVHEGPHQIRMQWRPAGMQAGMTITNEPGIYRAGKHGVRIENTMLVTPYCTTEFGEFLQLEALTLCPISTEPIVRELLAPDEAAYLNQYHQLVRKELLPLLADEADREWLIRATEEI